jgi:class 3 adenylate cyclase/tetratricopeptide (TPR) repeat protein
MNEISGFGSNVSLRAPLTCPVCGTPPVPGARFCFACGGALQLSAAVLADPAAERRIVTVLFGDLSDFTAWAEDRDPERVGTVTDRVIFALARAVEDLGGHVDKLTGDGIMAVFGAPTAHEDDPERAVRAAARMQQDVRRVLEDEVGGARRLGLRVGLNTGEVLAGVQAAMAYTVIGDTVNTASRLAGVAAVGTVYAGQRTAEATGDIASWRTLSPLRLRGKRTPVEAYELITLRPPAGVRLGMGEEAPFVGRDGALASLTGRLRDCIERRTPASMLLTGDVGIGKTRLISELVRVAQELPDAQVLAGRCSPYGDSRDLAPLIEWVRTAAGIAEDTEPDVALDRLRRTTTRVGLLDRLAANVVTAGLAGLLGLVDPAPSPRDTVTPGAGSAAGNPLLEWVSALLEGLSRDGPLLLVLDDLHWASSELLATVGSLLDRLSGPILLAGAIRSSWRDPRTGVVLDWWRTLPRPDVLPLDRLDEGSCDRLLTAYLGGASLAEDIRHLLLTRASGNPFFLSGLLHWLVDRRLMIRTADGWQLDGELPADMLPAGVQAVLAARIDDLPPSVRAVLGDAAVVGTTFSRQALEALAVAGGPAVGAALGAALDILVERELVVPPAPLLGRLHYAFTHWLTRDVAYDRLPKAERARRHAAIAAWGCAHLPGAPGEVDVFVASQAERALALAAEMHLPADDSAWQVREVGATALGRLGEFALARDDAAAADSRFTRALAAGGDRLPQRQRLRLVVARCAAQVRSHRDDGVDAELAPALVSEDVAVCAAAWVVTGDLRRRRGEIDAAREAFVCALAYAGESGSDRVTAEALRHLGLLDYSAGRLSEAETCFRDALDLARRIDDRRGAGWALQHLAWTATTRGRYPAAAEALSQAAEVFTTLEDSGGLSWCAGTEAFVHLLAGRLRAARALASSLIAVAEATGEKWGVAACRTISAHAAAELGDVPAAIAESERAQAAFAEMHDTWGEAMATIARGIADRCAGHPRRAARILREAVELSSAGSHPVTGALARAMLGYCHLDRHDASAAEGVAREALAYLSGLDLEPPAVVGVQVLLAQALRAQGRLAEALGLLDTAVDAALESSLLFPRRQALAHRAGALLDAGRVPDAVTEIERALAVPAEDVRSQVVALRVLAAVRTRVGDAVGARAALDEALAVALDADQRTEVESTRAALTGLNGLTWLSGVRSLRPGT